MLINEAKWFAEALNNIKVSALSPMINVGSSSEEFRKKRQPWIDEYVFAPLRERGVVVRHMDIKSEPGVDIVGDLSDPAFLRGLCDEGFKSVFCANLLEHVRNREEVARALTRLVSVGDYLFISCPYKFPFHLDPIDTMFRPDVSELAELFPDTSLVQADIISDGTYLDYLRVEGYGRILKTFIHLFLPIYKTRQWVNIITHLPWLFRNFQTTCLVLRKKR